ncbi:MAG: HEAT repeat domain-containing protein, partial [Kiritimatiellaeota bacterium]|nr:HEAT repeat domain-containing protein [Kiritimatiellota bacterium]
STNADERIAAAYDLGRLDDVKAVPSLLAALNDSDPDVVRVAGRSLMKLYPKRHPDDSELIPLLKSANPETRQQALLLLSESDDRDSFAEIAAMAGNETNMRVICVLAETLKHQKASDALPLLDALLAKSEDESASTAKKCVESMKYFGTEAAPRLIKRLDSPNKNVKRMALSALEEMSGRKYGYDTKKWKFWSASIR